MSLQSRKMQSTKHHGFPVPPAGTDSFYRAINPEHDKGDGTVSSAAFYNDSDGLAMSSNWGHMSTPESTAREWPQWSGPDRKVASIFCRDILVAWTGVAVYADTTGSTGS